MSYIDREDLQHELKRIMDNRTNIGDVDGYLLTGHIRRLVLEMPEADVVKARRGHWIDVDYEYMGDPNWAKCSECGKLIKHWETKQNRYCPKCGADMRGGGEREGHADENDS